MAKIKLEHKGLARPITSREYKLILNPDIIVDQEEHIRSTWSLITSIIDNYTGKKKLKKQSDIIEKTTTYIDTSDHVLRRNNFILRHRKNHTENSYKTTLKYRSSDRYISSNINISNNVESKIKFEEDILQNTNKYSLSASITGDASSDFRISNDIYDYFHTNINSIPLENSTFKTVNNFTAHEVTHWIGNITIGNGHKVKFCINHWYKAENLEKPILSELAFDYDLVSNKVKKEGYSWPECCIEQYHIPTVYIINTVFDQLKNSEIVIPKGMTKTQYAYNQSLTSN